MLGHQTVTGIRPVTTEGRTAAPGARLARPPMGALRTRLLDAFGNALVPRVVASMTLFVVALLFYLYQASQVSVLEYTIADLRQQQAELALANVNLHTQASRLRSVVRIQTIATTRLRMSSADPSTTIWVQPSIPVIVPPPAATRNDTRAKRESQPAHWMISTLAWLKAQL